MDGELRVDQATDHLQAYLNQRIAAINAAGGVQLAPVGNDHFYAGGKDLIPPDAHPAVEVAIANVATTNIDLAYHRGDSLYPISVVIHTHSPDYDVLWRSMYRYARAVAETLAKRDVLGSSATLDVRQDFAIELDEAGRTFPVWIASPRITAMIQTDDSLGDLT